MEDSEAPFVSADRMYRNGEIFTLNTVANMDIEAFNKKAGEYGVHIEESDPPIDRLVKHSIFLSRMDNDGSFIPTNEKYVKMALDVAAGKARDEEPFEFYQTLMTGPWDATGEILQFREKIQTGSNNGKYIAERLVFNKDAELENRGDIIVASEGWTSVLGARHCYPFKTSKSVCTIENIEDPALKGADVKGYWYVGSNPVGEQRLALRSPGRGGAGLLSAYVYERRSYSDGRVAALRLRGARPEDYIAQMENLREEAKKLQDGLISAQIKIGKLVAKE